MKINSYKIGYIVFIGLVILTLITNQILVQDRLKSQAEDAKLLSITGSQRILSQRIAKRIMYTYDILQDKDNIPQADLDILANLLNQIEKVHFELINDETSLNLHQPLSPEIRHLLEENSPYLNQILLSGREIIAHPDLETYERIIGILQENDLEFLDRMEAIVAKIQAGFEIKLEKLKKIELVLLVLTIVLLLLSFRLIMVPLIRALTFNNQKLAKLSDQTTRQNKQLLGFAHICSHNLRAPATNLKALIEFYKEESDPEERKNLIEKMETVSMHLNNTLEDLMATLKIKEGAKDNLQFVEFGATIQKIKEILTTQITASNTTIHSDFSQFEGMNFNKVYMESVFLNLISNGIKYRSKDRNTSIHIKSEMKDDKILLSFEDNGLGIDMKKYGKQLFGLNNTFHQHKEGRGVGLYLTKTQIEAMGGEISVESEVGKGSRFILSFPQSLASA